MENAVKTCPSCKSQGPFTKNKNTKDGLNTYCTVCKNLHEKLRNQRYRQETINLLGGKCCKCGFSDPRALQVDHIQGGGNRERKLYGAPNANALLSMVKADIDRTKFQLLCANCNVIKRIENGEF